MKTKPTAEKAPEAPAGETAQAEPEGNSPGPVKAAAPAAGPVTAPVVVEDESPVSAAGEYYDGLRQAKRAAGLSLELALEVTARQRAEDKANGVKPWLETEPGEEPAE